MSYPNKDASHYVTYDRFRCAQAALKLLPKKKTNRVEDDSSNGQEADSVSYFDVAFIFLIMINLGIVASIHVLQAPWFERLQTYTDIIMNVLYSCEVIIRWIAYNSFFLYVSNNPFDFCVVLISDIFLLVTSVSTIALPGINIFRVARLLRAVKISYRIPRVRLLFQRLFTTMNVAVFPCIMLLFWVFCFALIGIQLFKDSGIVSSRLGFESFDVAYVTAFSVMTFEKWLDVLDGLISTNQLPAILFFLVYVGVGKYLGLNGITASVLMTFSQDDVEKSKMQKDQYLAKVLKDQKEQSKRMSVVKRRSSAQLETAGLTMLRDQIAIHDSGGQAIGLPRRNSVARPTSVGRDSGKRSSFSSPGDKRSVEIELGALSAKTAPQSRVVNVLGLPYVKKAAPSLQDSFANAKDDSLLFLKPENSLRGIAVSIVSSTAFSYIILATIAASVVLLLSPTPYKDSAITPSITRTSDYVFQGIFVLEFLLKVVSNGLTGYLGYWQNPWNRLDLFIIIVGALDLIISALISDVQVLRFVRVLRMIRPLRLLNRFESLQVMRSHISGSA